MSTRLMLAAATAIAITACQSTTPTPAVPAAAPAPAAAAPAAPAPAWQQGRTADQASSTLAPHAGKLTATPASELPLDKLKLPPGFKAEVWATGVPGGRAMVRGDSGKVYVGTRGIGRVYEITDGGSARTSRGTSAARRAR